MKKSKNNIQILEPKNQLNLYGYESYFNSFINLFKKKKLPNSIIISGSKGLGKSTFVYHIINYLLSSNEINKYSINDFSINSENKSYKLINENTHPNFFLIENDALDKDIKVDQIRRLLSFLNKTTYSSNLKIVMIDNAEKLNQNSSNALLKAIEEPGSNTFFFLIYNNSRKILNTIKSRCVEFKIFFNHLQKKKIFENIISLYDNDNEIDFFLEEFYFETPGNLVKYFLILKSEGINPTGNKLPSILYFIEKFNADKNLNTLNHLSLFIEKFYNDLAITNADMINNYLFNQTKILKRINDMKKYNLNEKNILYSIQDIITNETR